MSGVISEQGIVVVRVCDVPLYGPLENNCDVQAVLTLPSMVTEWYCCFFKGPAPRASARYARARKNATKCDGGRKEST